MLRQKGTELDPNQHQDVGLCGRRVSILILDVYNLIEMFDFYTGILCPAMIQKVPLPHQINPQFKSVFMPNTNIVIRLNVSALKKF